MKKFTSLSPNRRDIFIAAIAVTIALAISIAYANVFVYAPIEITLQPVNPPVYFEQGSNAGKPDLGPNNVITANPGPNKESLAVVIHPTYQTTYYKNISIVINSDNKAYYVYFKVQDVLNNLPTGSIALLCVYGSNAPRSLTGWPVPSPTGALLCVDLLQTGLNPNSVTLNANSKVELDIYVYIPEGTSPSQTISKLNLIYTPTQETPP
ncbi:MAG: hypothetical protein DJ555_06455 [Desulfurococcaceae archaeon]|nr:MAG: hypothetical protein DJ555_06455 [Desulfurococcaceae archaeon]